MRILILTNFDVGLYQFRRELIQELLTKNEVYISLPYGELVAPLVEMGCFFFDTPMERRGMNPVRDAKLFAAYRRIFREVKPEKVICYTIKPNIYGGFAARLAGIPYAVNITGLGTACSWWETTTRAFTLSEARCRKPCWPLIGAMRMPLSTGWV